jgi:DNA-binding NarL/FixJ family response regulator
MPVRILVADDHQVVRRGLRALLESKTGWQVCAEAANGREAVELSAELKPDVAVLDIAMPLLNGVEATRQIRKLSPKTEVLILTMHDSDLLVQEVLGAGAHGFILKDDADRELVAAVDALRRHKPYLSSRVSEAVSSAAVPYSGNAIGNQTLRSRLTPREREIIQLLAEGKSNKEVAGLLGISVKTAETHRANIMLKLDFHSITELVRYAVRNKIIQG